MGGTNPEDSLARTKKQDKIVLGNVVTSLMKELVGAPKKKTGSQPISRVFNQLQVSKPFQEVFNPFTAIKQKTTPNQPLKRKNSEVIGEKGRRQGEQEGMKVSANSCLKAKCSNTPQN